MAASHTSTVCSQVARDMPTGTPPSSTPPPRASISAATAGGSFKHERGAVSVPQRPFFMLSHTEHRASAEPPPSWSPAFFFASASSASSSSARALFTLAVRSIISARHDATARACLNGRRVDIASSAALVARTHRPSTPAPNDTSASSSAFKSRSSHASVFFAAGFLFEAFFDARFAPRVARSSSSSEKDPPESSPEKSSSSPRRRLIFFPTIPTAPSLYESYMPLRLRGPVTRKRSSASPNANLSSRAARAASGSALAQKSSASKSSSASPAEKTAEEKVFPARAPMARCSARLPRIWSMSSFANAAASSPELSRRAPCTPYFNSRLILAASSFAERPAPPSPSPPPSTASSKPYFFAEVSNRLCSYVALVTSRYTFTSLVCPMRWQRAIACRSFCGFQSLS